MINKRISKITMLTCLMLGGIVNAQEFYTCVPKKSWWKDTMSESIKNNVPSADAIANAVKGAIPTPTPQKNWKLIKTIDPIINDYLQQDLRTLLRLDHGEYKFILKTSNGKTIQNMVDSPVAAELKLIARRGAACYPHFLDYLMEYDKRNVYYLARDNFTNCESGDDSGVAALILGNIALFAYEARSYWPDHMFLALDIYKKE